MSARAPFIPNGSRPASRAAHLQDQPQNSKNNGPFAPDLSNPLHPSGTAANNPLAGEQGSQQLTKADSAISAIDNATRPLNTASVLKTLKFKNAPRKPSMESAPIKRPPTADPTPMTQQGFQIQPHPRNQVPSSHIFAPVPRQPQPRPSSPAFSTASTTGTFTPNTPQNMFRLPVLPSLTELQDASSDTQPNNNAHIPTSSLGFSFSKPMSAILGPEQQPQHLSQLPSPPKSTRSGSSRLFGLNSSSLDTTDPECPPPFPFNLSGANQTGPQRVLLNPDGTRGSPINQALDSNFTDTRRMKRTTSESLKRPRPDASDDTTDHTSLGNDYGAHPKRYRSRGVRLLI